MVGDVHDTGDLFLPCGQCALEDLAQVTGAAVRGIIWGWPERDWLDGTGADGEILLDEELVFA